MVDNSRKSSRRAAKKLIRLAKENPGMYSRSDVMYAKLIKRVTKKDSSETGTNTITKDSKDRNPA